MSPKPVHRRPTSLLLCGLIASLCSLSATASVSQTQSNQPTCSYVAFPSDPRFVRGEFTLNTKDSFPVVPETTFKKGFVFVIKGFDAGTFTLRPKALTMMNGKDWRLMGGQFKLAPNTTYTYRIPTSGNAVKIGPITQNELARFKTTYGDTLPVCEDAPLGLSIG